MENPSEWEDQPFTGDRKPSNVKKCSNCKALETKLSLEIAEGKALEAELIKLRIEVADLKLSLEEKPRGPGRPKKIQEA